MPLVHLQDLPAALGLLTRLPIPVDGDLATRRGAMAAWAWPLAGGIIGGLVACFALLLLWVGLPLPLTAFLALACQIMLTGALHEDGLADTADGLWGGYDRARRLEIMKDSRIGAYGVIAIVLSLAARGVALTLVLDGPFPILALIAVGVISRLPMVLLMAAMPNARGSGLAQSVGRPGVATSGLAAALTLLIGAICLGWALLPLLLWGGLITIGLALIARAKIGGQTGDILGASQQLAEITGLFVLASLISP
ncbi:adenosylcobinamide-GDP ribazoletransferase [Aliiroseovarius crassostreae]|uniref:adenosylcobinamide-GDP ribazoletransferase n=1 Tax=Aliiroseovarius crassostreae TaxID=154981 RepID=UPI003C7D1D8B